MVLMKCMAHLYMALYYRSSNPAQLLAHMCALGMPDIKWSKHNNMFNTKIDEFFRQIDVLSNSSTATDHTSANKLSSIPTRIFLSTDTASVQQAFRKRYGQMVTWMKDIPGLTTKRESVLDIRDAMMNINLLTHCKYFVGTKNSTFSEFASAMMVQRVAQMDKRNGGSINLHFSAGSAHSGDASDVTSNAKVAVAKSLEEHYQDRVSFVGVDPPPDEEGESDAHP